MWEPPTVIQTSRLLASIAVIQTAKLLASITVERTSILLCQQTPRSKCRQFLYTAVRHLVAWTTTQALANQHLQLQLCLQLARTQPCGNGIKYGPSATRSSVHQFQYQQYRHHHQPLRSRQEIATAAPTSTGTTVAALPVDSPLRRAARKTRLHQNAPFQGH
jgi:hypothetical protein